MKRAALMTRWARDNYVPYHPIGRRHHGRLIRSPDKAKSPARKAGLFLIAQAAAQPLPDAESMGFKGEFRQWEHLLRIGD